MMRRTCLAAALLAATAPAQAALAPHYQRAAELRAVIDAAVAALDDGTPIDLVQFIEHDLYRASSSRCTVLVRIVERQASEPLAGRRQFDAVADAPDCEP